MRWQEAYGRNMRNILLLLLMQISANVLANATANYSTDSSTYFSADPFFKNKFQTFLTKYSGGISERFLNITHINGLKERSHNETRNRLVSQTLQAASGVYYDKDRGKKAGLEKTVFITVIAYNSKEGISHYKPLFRNFLCFAHQYGIDLVVYILHHHIPDLEEEMQSLESLGVRVLTYPDELFWSLVGEKKGRIIAGRNFAEYDLEYPSFPGFGALVMLVPQLEALELGYNVIYFDVDIGLVQDPVPYVTRGDADFTVSQEQRICPEVYPSSQRMETNWEEIEPNTGVMHLRATTQGIVMYRRWLYRIVETNVRNDQSVFDRHSKNDTDKIVAGYQAIGRTNFTSSFTPSCNWGYSENKFTPTERVTPHAGTYCFLSEMMFQNGFNAFRCSQKMTYRDDWYLEMIKQVPEIEINGNKFRLPVAVHANYCNFKSHELDVRGLWLYREKEDKERDENEKIEKMKILAQSLLTSNNDTSSSSTSTSISKVSEESVKNLKNLEVSFQSCKPYNVSKVFFATQNFTKEAIDIELYRIETLKKTLVKGFLVKADGTDKLSVYLISEKLEKLLIPDGDTFMSLGYEWKSVKTVPGSVVRMIPEGVPFNSTKIKVSNVPTSTPILTPSVSSKLGEDIIMRSQLKKLKLK